MPCPLLDTRGSFVGRHRAGGEAVITHDREPVGKDVRLDTLGLLVRPSVTLQKAIELFLAAIETVELMIRT
jgi:hypothetical protein